MLQEIFSIILFSVASVCLPNISEDFISHNATHHAICETKNTKYGHGIADDELKLIIHLLSKGEKRREPE